MPVFQAGTVLALSHCPASPRDQQRSVPLSRAPRDVRARETETWSPPMVNFSVVLAWVSTIHAQPLFGPSRTAVVKEGSGCSPGTCPWALESGGEGLGGQRLCEPGQPRPDWRGQVES